MHCVRSSGASSLPSRRKRRADKAYAALKAAITSGEFPPGDRLYETSLAKQFGMSRTPIREALQRLVNEGLAEAPAGGVRVAVLSVADVRALQQASRALQSLAAGLAAVEASEEEMRRLKVLVERMEHCARAHDYKGWAETDVKIHRRIFEMSRNPWISSLLLQMESLIARVRHVMLRQPGWLEQATREHRIVVDAIRSRPGKTAERAMHEHLVMAEKRLVETMGRVVLPWRGNRM